MAAFRLRGRAAGSERTAEERDREHAWEFERCYSFLATQAENSLMTDLISNFNERTHYLRIIDLRMNYSSDQVRQLIDTFWHAVETSSSSSVMGVLETIFERKSRLMNDLVRNAVGHAYMYGDALGNVTFQPATHSPLIE